MPVRTIDLIVNIDADEFAMDLPFDPKLDSRGRAQGNRICRWSSCPLRGIFHLKHSLIPAPWPNSTIPIIFISTAPAVTAALSPASLFKRQGIHNLHNIIGGWDEIKKLDGLDIVKENSVLN